MAGENLEGLDKLAKITMPWKKRHRFATIFMRARDIADPSPAWAARVRNDEHVGNLMSSFKKTGSVNESVHLVCLDTSLYEGWKAGNCKDAEDRLDMEAVFHSPAKLRPFAGDHTRVACERLAERFPKCQLWAWIKADVYLAANNFAACRMLRMLGNIDNKAAGLQLSTNFAQILL